MELMRDAYYMTLPIMPYNGRVLPLPPISEPPDGV